jgi:hypothetical protein
METTLKKDSLLFLRANFSYSLKLQNSELKNSLYPSESKEPLWSVLEI